MSRKGFFSKLVSSLKNSESTEQPADGKFAPEESFHLMKSLCLNSMKAAAISSIAPMKAMRSQALKNTLLNTTQAST